MIVPSPSDLQLAVPLERNFTSTLPVKRMKRAVRDGLDLASEPFDTRWGVWSIQAPTMVDDLEDLVAMKHQHLAKVAS